MITRWIITTTLMIGLTLVSFGHQSVAPDKQAQAYILAGGSWGDLCGDGSDPLANAAKCMACVISSGCGQPANSGSIQRDTQEITLPWGTQDQSIRTLQSRQSHTARAPPFV